MELIEFTGYNGQPISFAVNRVVAVMEDKESEGARIFMSTEYSAESGDEFIVQEHYREVLARLSVLSE